MTWYLDPETGECYEDDPAYSGKVDSSVDMVDGYEFPDDVVTVMREVWEEHANHGRGPVMNVRAGYILMDMIEGNIERGVPDRLRHRR